MAVSANPHHIAPKYLNEFLYLNEKIIRVINIIRLPTTKAMAMETKIPEIMANAFPLLMYWTKSPPFACQMLKSATATAAPSNSKTSETVVEVGKPSELKTSSRITSVSITARNSTIMFLNVNISGWKTPLRAISIIPLENIVPNIMPTDATVRITHMGATFEPILELRKFTASLATPTVKSSTANPSSITTTMRKIGSMKNYFGNLWCKNQWFFLKFVQN